MTMMMMNSIILHLAPAILYCTHVRLLKFREIKTNKHWHLMC